MSLKHLSYARFRFYGLWPGAARSQRSRSNVHAKKLKKRCTMVLRLRQLAAHMQAIPFGSSLTWKARCPLQASSAAGHHPLGQGRRRRFCRRCLFITDASARTSSLFWLLSSATEEPPCPPASRCRVSSTYPPLERRQVLGPLLKGSWDLVSEGISRL